MKILIFRLTNTRERISFEPKQKLMNGKHELSTMYNHTLLIVMMERVRLPILKEKKERRDFSYPSSILRDEYFNYLKSSF